LKRREKISFGEMRVCGPFRLCGDYRARAAKRQDERFAVTSAFSCSATARRRLDFLAALLAISSADGQKP
jgi:hypothetical protein